MSDDAATTTTAATSFVPELFRAVRSDMPVSVRTLRGLPALPGMVLLWFFPRTMGVRLAASGWSAAIVAHLVGVILGAGLIVWAVEFPQFNPIRMTQTVDPSALEGPDFHEPPLRTMTAGELVRAPFAAIVAWLHEPATPGIWPEPLTTCMLILLVYVLGLLCALCMMPFASAGESSGRFSGRLAGRCCRLMLWSTTMVIPLGIAWMLRTPAIYQARGAPPPDLNDWVFGSLFLLWWFVVLVRSTGRYAGPAEGPAWEPREPQCEACGYNIAMLPVSTNCPECGRPVAESLPARRQPTPFAAAVGFRQSFFGFFTTLRRAVSDPTYFDGLSVYRDTAPDRSFALWAAALAAGLVGTAVAIGGPSLYAPFGEIAGKVAIVVACIGFVVMVFIVGALAEVLEGKRRAMSSAAIVAFSMSSFFVALGLAALLVALAFVALAVFSEAFPQPEDSTDEFICAALGIGIPIILVFATAMIMLTEFRRAARQTRRANG